MKNVCFLLGNAKGDGGIARVVSIITNELAQYEDLKITIVSYSLSRIENDYEYNKRITLLKLFDHDTPMVKGILKEHAIALMKEIIQKEQIDIVFACGDLYFPLAIMSCRGSKAKCFCWEHSDPRGTTDHKFQKICRELAVLMADKILVLTKAAEKIYVSDYKAKQDRIIQIYNPVSNEAYSSKIYDINSKKIISVGRLSYQKNFQLLISIAREVFQDRNDWVWDIYGEGEDRSNLEQLIAEYHLEGRVNLKGQVDNLYSVYNQYSFQVMTSRYEGFPMSLLEGAANNLPLISFDIPTGPSEIIVDGLNGYLIKNENIEEMTNKIKLMMNNSLLRNDMSKQAGEMVRQFSLEHIIQRWRLICK